MRTAFTSPQLTAIVLLLEAGIALAISMTTRAGDDNFIAFAIMGPLPRISMSMEPCPRATEMLLTVTGPLIFMEAGITAAVFSTEAGAGACFSTMGLTSTGLASATTAGAAAGR